MKKTAEPKIHEAYCMECGVIAASGPDEASVNEAGKRHQAKKHPKAKAKK